MQRTVINSSGSGNIINVAELMEGVTNTVNQNIGKSAAAPEQKAILEDMVKLIASVSPKIDPTVAKQLGDDVVTLSNEMASASPRKKWYELSLEGIKDAAVAIGDAGKPIVETALKLAPLVGVLLQSK